MTPHIIEKALEVWTLQNLLNLSIILGIIALGLALVQQYYESLKKHLTLRVSIEIWNMVTVLFVDLILVFVVMVGFVVLNPDIMADIKIGLPFIPIAIILFAVALILRLFHGGHHLSNPNFMRSLWIMFIANILNIVGFTFVMEAPSKAYLKNHPSSFWTFLKTQLRSNANLELSQVTFLICFPILIIVLIWGFGSGIKQLKKSQSNKS
jgi:hypothetical protein